MLLFVAAAAAFQPVTATADVTTSNGKHYRLETCFRDPDHLSTRFIYPQHTQTFTIDGTTATTIADGGPPTPSSDADKRIALGHNFHAIYLNALRLTSANGGLIYGGSLTKRTSPDGRLEGYRFNSPDTTPIDVSFSQWDKAGMPQHVTLAHAGVTYNYQFTGIKPDCQLS